MSDLAAALRAIVEPVLRQVVREELAILVQKPANDGGAWMDADEVASLVGCKRRRVAELVRRQGLPCAGSVGRKLRFRRAEVERWMERK